MDAENFIEAVKEIAPDFDKKLETTLLYLIRKADKGLQDISKGNVVDHAVLDAFFEKSDEVKKAIHKVATYYYTYELRNTNQFNLSSVLKDIKYVQVGEIFKESAFLLSDFLVKAVLLEKEALQKISQNDFMAICKYMTSSQFITNLFMITAEGDRKLGEVIWSVLNSYEDLISKEVFAEQIKNVRDAWCQNGEDIALIFFDRDKVRRYEQKDLFFNELTKDLEADLGKEGKKESLQITETTLGCYGPIPYKVDCSRTYYGEYVCKWIESDTGPRQYDLCTKVKLENYHETKKEPTGCVLEGTLITLYDGTVKKIEEIVAYDAVLSKDGVVSICSDELVKTPGIQMVYGVNDEPACFTLEHALLTPQGWKSLDPEASNRINPHFNVTLLTCGDSIYKLYGFRNGKPDIRLTEVKQIHLRDVSDKKVNGYDLHFREGVPSFFANGILCLLNYPELTCARIGRNMDQNMTESEKACFLSMIADHRELFEKAFGTFAVQGFLNHISNL